METLRSQPGPTRWRALLQGGERSLARTIVHSLARDLRQARFRTADVAGGDAGAALFYGYLAQVFPDGTYGQTAEAYLQRALARVAAEAMPVSLFTGLTGVAWTLEHLEGAEEDLGSELDEALSDLLAPAPWAGKWDLVNGLVGLGWFGLRRRRFAKARAWVRRVTDHLHGLAESQGDGIAWRTSPELLDPQTARSYPRGYFDLGVAHGVPAILAFLAAILAAGLGRARDRELFDGGVRWFLAQRRQEDDGSCFGKLVLPSEAKGKAPSSLATRAAWCYGDPGIAMVLWTAAGGVDDPALAQAALRIGRRAAMRPAAESGVFDAGLCHGAAGLGHIFHRLYRATGEDLFAARSRFWFRRVLDMWRPNQAETGFLFLRRAAPGANRPVWRSDPGLLAGSMGVGLALAAAISDISPSWDQLLLLSLPWPLHASAGRRLGSGPKEDRDPGEHRRQNAQNPQR